MSSRRGSSGAERYLRAQWRLELAEVRSRGEQLGVLGPERARRLQRLRELRRLLAHGDAGASADQVHEAALIVSDEFAPFYDAYRRWIGRGFAPDPTP